MEELGITLSTLLLLVTDLHLDSVFNFIVTGIVAYLVWVHHKITNHDISIATGDKSHEYHSEEFKKINTKLNDLIDSIHRLEVQMTKNGQGDISS